MTEARTGIEALSPDVIGLQEIIVRPDGFDQANQLLDGLGYHWIFGPAFSWDDAGNQLDPAGYAHGFGNVIASRWPILEEHRRALPDLEDEERRGAVGIVVDSEHGELALVSTHLNWKFNHGHIRERQVVAVASFAWEIAGSRPIPPIVLGDFNAEPDSAEIRYMKGLQSLEGTSMFFEDAWAIAGDGGPGLTWDNRNPFARQVNEPNRRIDYIFAGYDHDKRRITIRDCRVAMNESKNGVFPTDHFGLMAWVEL